MTHLRPLRLAVPTALLSLAVTTLPAMALEPSVEVVNFPSGWSGGIADVASRGSTVVVTADVEVGGVPVIEMHWSTDGGASSGWDGETITSSLIPRLESAAVVCDGRRSRRTSSRWTPPPGESSRTPTA
ncbi:MAG: hypothetical protein U0667_16025 [Chloroflexota bacterium]